MEKTAYYQAQIKVTIDESKFDEAFMKEFREDFLDFHTLDDHIEHIGQLAAREIWNDTFVEGYGKPSDMGIKVELVDAETWVE